MCASPWFLACLSCEVQPLNLKVAGEPKVWVGSTCGAACGSETTSMMLCGFFRSAPVRIIIGDLNRVCFVFLPPVSGSGPPAGKTPVTAQRAVVSSRRPRGPEMACLIMALQALEGSGELRAIFAAIENVQSSQSPSDARMTTPPDLGNGIDIVKGCERQGGGSNSERYRMPAPGSESEPPDMRHAFERGWRSGLKWQPMGRCNVDTPRD
jgi:hypothetical protein